MTTRVLQLRLLGPALLTGLLLFGPQAHAGEEHQLSNGEIKRLITGKVVTDEVHYTDYFKVGGAYEGVFMNKRLSGTWSVKGDLLCITRGSEAENCDELWRSGSRLQRRKPGLPNVRDDVVVRMK